MRFIRRGLALGGLALVLVILIVFVWLGLPQTAINVRNLDRICDGMALSQVEQILGGPARDEATGPLIADLDDEDEGHMAKTRDADGQFRMLQFLSELADDQNGVQPSTPLLWKSNRLLVLVRLNANNRVESFASLRVRPRNESVLNIIRRWFGR